MSGYYYLHTNGDLIYKPRAEVCDLRDSDFVKAFWSIDPSDRENGWTILVEASALGANKNRIKELAEKWWCSDTDAEMYAERIGVVLGMDGNAHFATKKDFINLQESPAGFGDSSLEAIAMLAKDIGYKASKMWGVSFKELLSAPTKAEAA